MRIKKDSLLLIITFGLAGLLIAFSAEAKAGAQNGMSLAGNIIVPSLLPLLIIFNLVIFSGAGRIIDNILSPLTRALRLPRCAGAAILFGLIGGYPTGAVLTNTLFENRDIDENEARCLMRFNVNGGAGFIITALGTGILQSKRLGLILFAATTLGAIVIMLLSPAFLNRRSDNEITYLSLPPAEALNKAVENAVKAVLNLSAYIVLFSAVAGIITLPKALLPIAEITSGLSQNGKTLPPEAVAALLSFSGFCIHLQLFPIIKGFKMKYADFLLWRVIHGVISFAVCKGLLLLFPIKEEVFSNYSGGVFVPTSVNAALSILMILGSAVLIFDIENRKRA